MAARCIRLPGRSLVGTRLRWRRVCSPLKRVSEQPLKGGMIVNRAVVSQRNTYDTSLGMLDDKDHGKGFVFGRRMGGREDFDRSALWIRLEPIKLIFHCEFGGQAAHERMIGFCNVDFKFPIMIMPARTPTT